MYRCRPGFCFHWSRCYIFSSTWAHKMKNPLNSGMTVALEVPSQTHIRVRSLGAVTHVVCHHGWCQLSRSPLPVLKVNHRIQGLNFRHRDFQTLIHPLTHSLSHTYVMTQVLLLPPINTYCNCERLRHHMTLCGLLQNGLWRTKCLEDRWNKASSPTSPFSLPRCCSLSDGILKMEDEEQKGWFPFFGGRHFYEEHNSGGKIHGQFQPRVLSVLELIQLT